MAVSWALAANAQRQFRPLLNQARSELLEVTNRIFRAVTFSWRQRTAPENLQSVRFGDSIFCEVYRVPVGIFIVPENDAFNQENWQELHSEFDAVRTEDYRRSRVQQIADELKPELQALRNAGSRFANLPVSVAEPELQALIRDVELNIEELLSTIDLWVKPSNPDRDYLPNYTPIMQMVMLLGSACMRLGLRLVLAGEVVKKESEGIKSL